jgi:hypothetical protein
MRTVRLLRLLLEVYGAAFLLVIAVGLVQGYFPYRAFLELGLVRFYLLLALTFIAWAALAVLAVRRDRVPRL